ncbi:preprotein translocase subunit SecG [Serinibacter salmoneus]|uniref:Protein-export membrane protein SecG n=1 Tax=Serinibacter salmoneus TaxID=556530 RepID=A0A2A9CZ66_9MICO|nr:preprotein translocase subunit SecG [Serinibacter salmoneus]PFG19724.1 protein translocase subunit secG [Serinibacter salmoneus]
MDALRIGLQVILVLTSVILVLTILMHKGRGGGMSDMFGGGLSSGFSSSGVAERNLNRITIGTAVLWGTCVILLGLIQRYSF